MGEGGHDFIHHLDIVLMKVRDHLWRIFCGNIKTILKHLQTNNLCTQTIFLCNILNMLLIIIGWHILRLRAPNNMRRSCITHRAQYDIENCRVSLECDEVGAGMLTNMNTRCTCNKNKHGHHNLLPKIGRVGSQ